MKRITISMALFFAWPVFAAEGLKNANEGETLIDADSKKNSAMTPVVDVPGLPRVLLIGDSISIGYTLPVRERLLGKANVHRIPQNGGATEVGLARIDAWLGDSEWDVIHFNFGLHDAKYSSETTQRATREQYADNLRELVARMKSTGAKLVFATTTPVPMGGILSPTRKFDSVEERNRLAVELMEAEGVVINDLYAVASPVMEKVGRPGDVHFQPEGYAILAAAVADVIERVLPEAKTLEEFVARAGNCNDDRDRQLALAKLAGLPSLNAGRRVEARSLAEFARQWNESGLKFYRNNLKGQSSRAVGEYDFGLAEDSPLRSIAEFYRGRMLAWTLIESSTVRTNPKDAKWFKDEAVASFERVAEAFPHNVAARMYLGEKLPWGTTPAEIEGAPEWATLQREQLERIAEIIHWWIEHRQRENGEFGGGWGDDCEMWRWWASVLLGFEDPEIVAAQLKFSKAAVERPHLKGGFNTRVSDVEHAAEDTTDNLIPLMALEPAEPRWTEWGLKLGEFMGDVWTGRNRKGQLQFKSFYFSATGTAPQPERACDVIANVGAIHPALLAWQRTGDERIGELVCEWLDTWVEATAMAEGGKPAGVLPASIRWPDGTVGGAGGNWWEPIKPGGYMHSYYIWPSVITEMTDAMMLAHVMTGKESYLEPLRSMAAIRLKYLKEPPTGVPSPGTEAWCGEQLAPRQNANSNTGGLVKTLARFKALTGTEEFDELIFLEGSEFVVRDDEIGRSELESALRESLSALRVNFPGFTSEVRSTDRCVRFVQFLAEDYAFDEYKGVTQPKHELLYRMVTGDKNAPRFPQMAVRWLTPPQEIAALVTASSTEQFSAELFHFGESDRAMGAEMRQLISGSYHWDLRRLHEEVPLATGSVKIEGGGYPRIGFNLPSRSTCVLRLYKDP